MSRLAICSFLWMAQWGLADLQNVLDGTCYVLLPSRFDDRGRQQVLPKRWVLSTKLHGVIPKKISHTSSKP